ncbi:MAG: hypothetical protein K0B85_10380, partial [Coriobacteriia bacterium]|nr:hypothetical protein [Coriobacteriia bacterium]
REVTVHIVGLRRTETPDPDGLPAVRSPSTAYPGPSSSSCLRCHRSVLRGIVVSAGVRMEHAHVLAAGGRCPDCHVGIAHPGAVERPRYSRMEACMLCHDARQAPAECTFCHEGDIGLVSRVAGARPAPEIDVPAPQHCRGCHSETVQQGCIDCHGLELPHPPAWTEEVTHARPGFVDRDNCLRCHDERRYCNRCHRFPSLHQPTARWVGLHGRAAQGRASVPYNIASCVFSECHSDQFCDLCHDGRRVTAPSGLYRQPCHSSAGSARDELVLIPLDSACH